MSEITQTLADIGIDIGEAIQTPTKYRPIVAKPQTAIRKQWTPASFKTRQPNRSRGHFAKPAQPTWRHTCAGN